MAWAPSWPRPRLVKRPFSWLPWIGMSSRSRQETAAQFERAKVTERTLTLTPPRPASRERGASAVNLRRRPAQAHRKLEPEGIARMVRGIKGKLPRARITNCLVQKTNPTRWRTIMSDNGKCDNPGCVGTAIIVLIVLWFIGYWDKPKTTEPAPAVAPSVPMPEVP